MARGSRRDAFAAMSLIDHLEELRWRIIYSVIAWLVGTGLAYNERGLLMTWLRGPLDNYVRAGHQVTIAALSVIEPVVVVFQVSLFGGLVVALPVIVYQLWAFIAPGLTRAERSWAGPFVVGLGGSFALGVFFAYKVVLPYAVPFMLGFLPGVTNLLSVGRYFTDIVTYLGIFGLLFELPITLFLLTKIGLVTPQGLSRARRYSIMGIAVFAAIITPTVDPINMGLVAVPLWLLYEVGVVLSRLAVRPAASATRENLTGSD
ncbi:MAG TPA: twin-arginine translocase subunit TatC [Deinococcales bacterium]|nr:twin-arginine translocase subunit TatC [Deinococcales bacterium]